MLAKVTQQAPSRRTQPGWRTKPLWQCRWGVSCRADARGMFYCPTHRAKFNRRQRRGRALRRQLGFCYDCTAPPVRGARRCASCQAKHLARERRYSKAQQSRRGWRWARVPC